MTRHSIFSSFFGMAAALSMASPGICFAEGEGGESGGGGTILTGGSADAGGAGGEQGGQQGESNGGAGENLYGKEGGETKPKEGDIIPPEKKDEKGEAAPEWKEYENDPDKTDEENAAAKAEHDKDKPETDEEKKKREEEEGKPIDPTSYELVEIPEGFELDPAIDKEFREFAASRKWSKEDVKELSAMQVKLYAKQSEAHAERVAGWAEEVKADKEIGGRDFDVNAAKAREAKLAFFPPEVDAILDKTGLGNHPGFIKGFVRIGKAMGEMGTLPGKGQTKQSTILENLYGDS
jgi:hypothetical protein